MNFSLNSNIYLMEQIKPVENMNIYQTLCCNCSVAKSCPTLCNPMDYSMPGSPVSLSPGIYQIHVHWWWCHPTISSSITPFFSCLQSFPASGSFLVSQFFPLDGQSIGVSASASVLPMNLQVWFPLGWTDWISWLSRVFSNTTVQKQQFFSTQPSLWFNSHIRTWLLEKP